MTLNEIHQEMRKTAVVSDVITGTNIDDIIWYAKSKGITELGVLPSQLPIIWQFLAANISVNDIEMRRSYFIECKCPRILGVDIIVLPYETVGS